jgi:ribokinase
VIGSANVDYTVQAARLPRAGETVSAGTLLVNHGGKGANQAVAARRLGADVRFIGCVGDDAAGRGIRGALAGEGIEVGGVAVTGAAATGTALIMVDAEGRNQIAVAPGANRLLAVDHVRDRTEDFVWADVVVCQLETPVDTVAWALDAARRQRAITILNPAPVPPAPLACWSLVDYLTPNEGEAARLSGMAIAGPVDVTRAAEALRARGVGAVVVTCGPDGVLACTADGTERVPARAVAVVDTTAAGDAFNGALAVALAEARRLREALGFATAAAALACTRRGAQASLPMRTEVERLLGA